MISLKLQKRYFCIVSYITFKPFNFQVLAAVNTVAEVSSRIIREPTRRSYTQVMVNVRRLVRGRTVLIPKEEGASEPDKFRPITCLNTTYKLLTGGTDAHHVEEKNL